MNSIAIAAIHRRSTEAANVARLGFGVGLALGLSMGCGAAKSGTESDQTPVQTSSPAAPSSAPSPDVSTTTSSSPSTTATTPPVPQTSATEPTSTAPGTPVVPTPTSNTTDSTSSTTSTASSEPEDSAPNSSEAPETSGEVTTPDTAVELVASWGLGWNLGNSLDVPESETTWGNPIVEPSLLTAVADAGFDVVRIPVTWSMFTGEAPNYAIDPTRMARVEEVVGYVLDAGMDAIINLHHDGADEYDGVEWLTLTDENGNISETVNNEVEARFRAVWTQIAAHFADFDERLLFESMNEIHDGYDAPDTGYYPIINRLNQTFVDVVRSSGGNNDTRKLVVPGYNTNIDYTLAGFEAPEDPTANRLILSVHFYDPWSFAGEGATAVWGSASPGTDSWGQEDYVVGQFDKLQATYIEQGLPVIIGEYGAINRTGSESYRRYYMEYVTQAACQRGIAPIYWDNGGVGSGADNFGLIERSSKELAFPAILDAMFRGCQSTGSLDSIAKP